MVSGNHDAISFTDAETGMHSVLLQGGNRHAISFTDAETGMRSVLPQEVSSGKRF